MFASVGSTSDVLRERAAAGAGAGAVAIAEQQTEGRGQHGRRWLAPPGSSLLMSVLLRASTGEALAAAPLRIGLAVAQAVEERTGVDVRLKWPNDLLVADRKVGGILCEAVTTATSASIIAGIGLNCLQAAHDFPPELAPFAASLRMVGGRVVRAELAGAILRALADCGGHVAEPLSQTELQAFAARDALYGRSIVVDDAPIGIADGITPAGALRVRADTGLLTVHSGSVRLARVRDVAHERAQ